MKPVLALLILGFLAVGDFATESARAALTVAVYDFTGDAEAASYASKVTTLVTADLATDTKLVMLERGALNKALSEQAFGASGLVNADGAARIGRITGVKMLVCGQVIMLEHNRVVIIANIIGTENARLFAVKVEGAENNLVELTSDLSSKIAQTVIDEAANLVAGTKESDAARLERVIKNIHGTKRPTVSISFYHPSGPRDPSFTANTEMGLILQKAGFTVVDGNSERKPDVEITGVVGNDDARSRGELHMTHSVIEIKVQERRTGLIIAMDRQEASVVGSTQMNAQRSAQALAVDELASRILPLLAK
jgi:Curli production assembly/transport component CsgG